MTDKLRELAERCNQPGGDPWWTEADLRPPNTGWLLSQDCKFIDAASPAAVLALLDDLDEAKAIIRAFCRSGGSASSGMVTTGAWSLDKLAEAEKRAVAFLSKGEGE